MPNKRRYICFYHDDNEWLADKPPTDPQELGEWHIAWARLRKDCEHEIEISEEMYTNSEDSPLPDWVDIEITDEAVLDLKMGMGVVRSIPTAHAVVFDKGFTVGVSKDWGKTGFSRLYITASGGYMTITSDSSSEELEIGISEQLNQVLGED